MRTIINMELINGQMWVLILRLQILTKKIFIKNLIYMLNTAERTLLELKVLNKPPKPPRKPNEAGTLNPSAAEFENERPLTNSNKVNTKDSLPNEGLELDDNMLKPNHESIVPTRPKKKKSSKKVVKAQFNKYNNFASKNPDMKKTRSKGHKKYMVPIELDGDNFTVSDQSSLDEEVEKLLKPIESLNDLFDILGVRIDSETDTDLMIDITSQNTYISVPKTIFEPFCQKVEIENKSIKVETLKTHEDHKSLEEVADRLLEDTPEKSPIAADCFNFKNLRIADDMVTDSKNASPTSKDITPSVKGQGNINDVFANLEIMDGESTLMDGIDSDDDSDAPPQLVPSQNLPVNQKKSETKRMPEISIEEIKVPMKKDESKPKNPMHQVKTLSFKVPKDRIYDPNFEIQRLREELRLRDAEIHQLSSQVNVMKTEKDP